VQRFIDMPSLSRLVLIEVVVYGILIFFLLF
jgi:hypothetical protein